MLELYRFPIDPPRNEPVRRDEVQLEWERGIYALKTMPTGTFQLEKTSTPYGDRLDFGGVPGLWEPLWAQVAAEVAAEQAEYDEFCRQSPHLFSAGTKFRFNPDARFSARWAYEHVCVHCGRRYLGSEDLRWHRVGFCSNHCVNARREALRRQWREEHPLYHKRANAPRAASRAEARAGRTCEHCGKSIEAARSTRRFCSDICRVRAHREKPQAAQ